MNGQRVLMFLAAIGLTVLLLFGNVFVQKNMDRIIREDQLVDEGYIEGAPPLVAFTTVALGGFRGIITDFLWFRAVSLQDQGKYFELAQLASWIMTLQPKSTAAAAYLGWNMAYNISVTCRSHEDRWRWVHRGIEVFLQTLRTNPNDPELYKELGWIYQHKLGNVLDDAQRYYKSEMARMYLHAYGAHYPDWQAIADAPRTEREFKEHFPEDHSLWKIISGWGFVDLKTLEERFRFLGTLPPDMEQIPPSIQGDKAVKRLTQDELALLSNYLRSKYLREEYLLDPSVILDINQTYGELDWLLPESFAIYWATLGVKHNPPGSQDTANVERMIVQSLQVSASHGRMLLPDEKATMDFILVPNLNLYDAARKTYKDTIERNPTVPSFKHALEYFYTDATVALYTYGNESKAREYYQYLRNEFKGNKASRLDFDSFILLEFTEDLTDSGFKQAHEFISSLIFRSCILIGYGDIEAATSHLKLAQMAHMKYRQRFTEERTAIPDFQTLKNEITSMCIRLYPQIADRLKAQISYDQSQAEAETKATSPTN